MQNLKGSANTDNQLEWAYVVFNCRAHTEHPSGQNQLLVCYKFWVSCRVYILEIKNKKIKTEKRLAGSLASNIDLSGESGTFHYSNLNL
jgi:hypothetical protein